MQFTGTFLQKDVIPQNAAYNLLIAANNEYYDVEIDAENLPPLSKGDQVQVTITENQDGSENVSLEVI